VTVDFLTSFFSEVQIDILRKCTSSVLKNNNSSADGV
jgi:hypothetical protein